MRPFRFPAGIDQQSMAAEETTLGVIRIPYVYVPPTILNEAYAETAYAQNMFIEDGYKQAVFSEDYFDSIQ